VVPESIHTPPYRRSLEIPRGEGGFKSQTTVLEGKYEAKLEFPAGCGGAKQKNLVWGEYGYFLHLHIVNSLCTKDM